MENYLGNGIYTIRDVSRFARVPYQSVSRWVKGYNYKSDGTTIHEPAVHSPDYAPIDGNYALSFLDLIEIRFISAFRSYGISLQVIRKSLHKAKQVLAEDHPFSSKKFLTDGENILYRVQEETGDSTLMNLLTDQYILEKILEQYLKEGLEFRPDQSAKRWWPAGFDGHVVLDPERSFGHPILDEVAVPTSVLFQSFKVEGSTHRVADWFEVPENLVVAAVNFEESLIA